MFRYCYRDTPVPVLLQKVPAFLYRDKKVLSYALTVHFYKYLNTYFRT